MADGWAALFVFQYMNLKCRSLWYLYIHSSVLLWFMAAIVLKVKQPSRQAFPNSSTPPLRFSCSRNSSPLSHCTGIPVLQLLQTSNSSSLFFFLLSWEDPKTFLYQSFPGATNTSSSSHLLFLHHHILSGFPSLLTIRDRFYALRSSKIIQSSTM